MINAAQSVRYRACLLIETQVYILTTFCGKENHSNMRKLYKMALPPTLCIQPNSCDSTIKVRTCISIFHEKPSMRYNAVYVTIAQQ